MGLAPTEKEVRQSVIDYRINCDMKWHDKQLGRIDQKTYEFITDEMLNDLMTYILRFADSYYAVAMCDPAAEAYRQESQDYYD